MEVSEIKELIGKGAWVMVRNRAVECKITAVIVYFSKDEPIYNCKISVHDTDIKAHIAMEEIAFSREELLKRI